MSPREFWHACGLLAVAFDMTTASAQQSTERRGSANCEVPSTAPASWPDGSRDCDGDGISDAFEALVAKRFAPIVHMNNDRVYRPVRLRDVFKEDGKPALVLEGGPKRRDGVSFNAFAKLVSHEQTNKSMNVWSHFNWEDSKPPIDSKPDLFVHVSFVNEKQRLVSIQYFWFCAFSDADFPFNGGDHDGDWLGVELWVAPPEHPRDTTCQTAATMEVQRAIFHIHGWQLVGPRSACRWNGDRLDVYAEHNSNEPWPIPGKDGNTDAPGMTKIGTFDHRVVREHSGKGTRPVSSWHFVYLGESTRPGFSAEARVFMGFAGKWGKNAGIMADLSRSPRFQPKMWKRAFAMPK